MLSSFSSLPFQYFCDLDFDCLKKLDKITATHIQHPTIKTELIEQNSTSDTLLLLFACIFVPFLIHLQMKNQIFILPIFKFDYRLIFFLFAFRDQVVATTIGCQIKNLLKPLVLCAIFWLIFAIMGVQCFAGKFYHVSEHGYVFHCVAD